MLKRLFAFLCGNPSPAKADPEKPQARKSDIPLSKPANDFSRTAGKPSRTSLSASPAKRDDSSSDLLNPLNPLSPISVWNTTSDTTHHTPSSHTHTGGGGDFGGGGSSGGYDSGGCSGGDSGGGGGGGGGCDITSSISDDFIFRRLNKTAGFNIA